MATAGRILIMPKGAYDASATYKMLDMVGYNGTSWLAKKTVVGIEPSDANSEYWHKMFDLSDVSTVANATNSHTVDGYHLLVVTEVPTTQDAKTIYFKKKSDSNEIESIFLGSDEG